MKAELRGKTYIRCPDCGKGENRVCHLFDMSFPVDFGPWYCDACGTGYKGTIRGTADIEIALCDTPRLLKVVDVLVLEPQDRPLYVAVASKDYGCGLDDKRYLYEEHTCPTNWTRDVEMLMIGSNTDPHGLFQYLGTEYVPDDFFDGDNDEALATIIEKMRGTCTAEAHMQVADHPGRCLGDPVSRGDGDGR